MTERVFNKGYWDCDEYNGIVFNFELIIRGDDMYPANTLLFGFNRTENLLSKTIFNDEIDLTKWDNNEYKKWIDLIKLGESCEYNVCVKYDEIPLTLMTMKYDKVSNVITIPLREGKYYVDNVRLSVDANVINELYDLYYGIEKYHFYIG